LVEKEWECGGQRKSKNDFRRKKEIKQIKSPHAPRESFHPKAGTVGESRVLLNQDKATPRIVAPRSDQYRKTVQVLPVVLLVFQGA
jgi:hypothetical protein